ncbi:MAG: metallophosphoesterase, partial [Chloroflexota bacterium]
PFQLAKTAVEVAISAILGTRVDYRLIETLTADEQELFNYHDEEELWIDYVADLADGWNPTYTIASLLGRESLVVPGDQGWAYRTHRGNLLIMGGDQVYPTASREAYRTRLIGPYECAFDPGKPEPPLPEEAAKPYPHLFAIPGNHDWYDGLISFTRLFSQGRTLAGWTTRQRRSYFALQLPGRWWLLGVDIQLEADIDRPQLEYFRNVAKQMQTNDKVILCTAAPDWIYGNIHDKGLENNLAFLEKRVIEGVAGAKVLVTLSGDLHHYRRHESVGETLPIHKITAGGGGAFLHPTNGPDVSSITIGPEGSETHLNLKAEFPTRAESNRMTFSNLLFPILNPSFGLVTGFAYLMIIWLLTSELDVGLQDIPFTLGNISTLFELTLHAIVSKPSILAWGIIIVAAFTFFTDSDSKLFRYLAGSIHGFSHLIACLFIGWGVIREVSHTFDMAQGTFIRFIASGAGVFIGGYLAGGILMGIYLFISLYFFGNHLNEAFSSLKIEDYKNFLRLHIDSDGKLTIYPIGIKKVPRSWVLAPDPGLNDPKLVPANNETIEVALMEPPIKVVTDPIERPDKS